MSHLLLIAASVTCSPSQRRCEGSGAAEALLLVGGAVLVLGVAYLWHRPFRSEPPKRRARRPPRPAPPRLDESAAPTADTLEYLAERTSRLAPPHGWSNRGSRAGKLTYASWITRWWASGPFMRRILIRQTVIVVGVCAAGVVAWLVLR